MLDAYEDSYHQPGKAMLFFCLIGLKWPRGIAYEAITEWFLSLHRLAALLRANIFLEQYPFVSASFLPSITCSKYYMTIAHPDDIKDMYVFI